MRFLLQQISTLIPGTHVASMPHGAGFLLQPRQFDAAGNLLEVPKPTIVMSSKLDRYLLRVGDVLLTAKGNIPFAVCYDGHPAPAVPASAFMIIRLAAQQEIHPQYLCWYLNHPQIQKQLSALAMGTSLPAITKGQLEVFSVSVPPLDRQKQIVALSKLQAQKEALLREISVLEKQQFQSQLYTLAQ